jgi:hypothetical protein
MGMKYDHFASRAGDLKSERFKDRRETSVARNKFSASILVNYCPSNNGVIEASWPSSPSGKRDWLPRTGAIILLASKKQAVSATA